MKKILAMILAVVMVATFAPPTQTFAADEASLVYELSITSFTIPEGTTNNNNVYNLGKVNFGSFDVVEGKNAWKLVNVVDTYTSLSIRNPFINWVFTAPTTGPVFTQNSTAAKDLSGAIAFEITVPEGKSGVYVPALKLRKTTTPANIEGYLVKKDKFLSLVDGDCYNDYTDDGDTVNEELNFRKAILALDSADRVGSVKPTFVEGSSEYEELEFPVSRELTAGSYIFVLIPNGESGSGSGGETVCMHSLILNRKLINNAVDVDHGMTNTTQYMYSATPVRNPSRNGGTYFSAKTRYDCYPSGANGKYSLYVAFPVDVANTGRYEVQMKAYDANRETGAVPAIYVVHEDDVYTNYVSADGSITYKGYFTGATSADLRSPIGYYNFSTASTTEYTPVKDKEGNAVTVELKRAGKYYIVLCPEVYSRSVNWKVRNTADNNAIVDTIDNGYINADGTLKDETKQVNAEGVKTNSAYQQDISLAGIKLKAVKTAEDTAAEQEAAEKEAAKNEIINEDGGNVEATGNASTEATVNAIAAYIDGTEIDGDVITVGVAEIGKDCTVTAKPVSGYKFLYWAKALDSKRRILSDKAEYTFKPTSGTNNLMAVYVSDSAETRKKAEFYNGNKQLLESFNADFTVPTLPTMAGHNKDAYWELAGTGEKYYGGESVTLDGEMLFVARYADPDPITVTVVGGEGSGTYNYGDVVTATATTRENSNGYNVFNYWEKGGEIVGFGTTYTFNAYETCTVTAVYKEYQPIAKTLTKIILKNINNGNVMAEYIGLENAVEKGMIFGGETLETATYRVAMTGSGKQFAVENDKGIFVTGYAILSDGSVVYDK